ncbi:MAG: hypothetical protein JXQ74_01610 [Alphaproteobacteria bacterium]|nr:hypothetical protein [Alphaproteobacteria bacterium]
MSTALRSFYNHVVVDKDSHISVFIREKEGYYLAFIYPVDQKKFEAEYEKEGVFFRNLQMPPIYAYVKQNSHTLLEQDQKDADDLIEFDKPEQVSVPKLKQFSFAGTKLLSDGTVVELWKGEDGSVVQIYPDHIFKNMGNER